MIGNKEIPELTVEKYYYVRTLRNDYVGLVVQINSPYSVTMVNAAWIANSGRLHLFVKKGKAPNMEVEPVGDIGIIGIIEWHPWPHGPFLKPIPAV
jgi:hypothetical protein